MTKKLFTITIGIPAYNEEANIGFLLESLTKQELSNFEIENIIVNSDGSNDDTAIIVKKYADKKVSLWDDGGRKGQSVRQNEIIEKTSSDILVLLNADIKLSGNDYLEILCQPILNGFDLVSSKVLPMKPLGVVESILKASYDYKEDLFESINHGDNIYTCKGAARAMSKKYYTDFRFSKSVGEDAYTYLYCKYHELKYYYQPDCVAFIRLPNNLSDYLKQSTRFLDSKARFTKEFGESLVHRQYIIPKKLVLEALFGNLVKEPIRMSIYLLMFGISTIKVKLQQRRDSGDVWETAKSSKKLL